MVDRGVTLRGEGEDITAAKIKASGTPKGSLVVLSHKDALLTGLTVTDNKTKSGGNNAANGVTILQDGGTMRDCVLWNNRRCNEKYPEYGAISLTDDKCAWENVFADIAKVGVPWKTATAEQMAFADLANGDYRLTTASVAKDSGEKRLAEGIATLDLDGNLRRVAPRIDAGCYEEQNGPGLKVILR